MTHELLETIEIIGRQLLRDSKFCGSDEGRRLVELLYEITGNQSSRTVRPAAARREFVTRTLSLPVDLDTAMTTVVEKSGLSRDVLIANALASLIAEDRLA